MFTKHIVSVFHGAKDSRVKEEKDIDTILLEIQQKYKSETDQIRAIPSDQKERRNSLKRKLNAVTFSGTFNHVRQKVDLKDYNPVIVLDIDKLDPSNLNEQYQLLSKDNYVYSCWISPSGTGIKGLVYISYEKDMLDSFEKIERAHKTAFSKLSIYFFEKYNIELDSSGNDITRLCYLSHDSNLHRKNNLSNFIITKVDIADSQSKKITQKKIHNSVENHIDKKGIVRQSKEAEQNKKKHYAYNRRKMQQIVKFLEKGTVSITEDYKSWVYVAFALSTTFPYLTARKYYLRLCRLDGKKHDERKSIWQFDRCYKHNQGIISFSLIISYASKKGYYGGHREESAVPKAFS